MVGIGTAPITEIDANTSTVCLLVINSKGMVERFK